MTTYIITPFKKAYTLKEGTSFIVSSRNDEDGKPLMYFVEMPPFYGTSAYVQISPNFNVDNYEDPECAEYDAICWLEDFIIRLGKNPPIIHCTEDGEMFTR